MQFLIRTMDLRQKVLFASERAKVGLKYHPELVQTQFLQTLLTGLQDDAVRADIKPYLQDPAVQDEMLLEKMSVAYSVEQERKSKLLSVTKQKGVKVAMVQEEESNENEQVSGAKKNKNHSTKPNPILEKLDADNKVICEALQTLTTHVASLSQANTKKDENKPAKTKQNSYDGAKRNPRKCSHCEKSNPEGRCTHCYKCGSSEHWAIGCRKRKDTTASTCKIEVATDRLNYAATLTSQAPLTRKQERTAKLVGRKSLVQCNLGGVPTTVLWDTGSQVSIVDMDWKNKHLPDTEIRPVQELLDEGMLDLTAANGTEIPYEGWIGVEFSLSANKDSELLVPLLVTPDPLAKPIIGFNVIKELAQANVSTDRSFTSKFVHSLGSALDVGHKKARAVYSVLKKQKGSSEGQIARLGRQDVIVPKHKVATVVCGKLNKAY